MASRPEGQGLLLKGRALGLGGAVRREGPGCCHPRGGVTVTGFGEDSLRVRAEGFKEVGGERV